MNSSFRSLAFATVLAFGLAFGLAAHAAPQPVKVKPGSIAKAVKSGFFAGGEAASEFSLIEATAKRSGDSETLVLHYGDLNGQPLRGKPGFFQASLDRDGRRVVVDLSQVSRTAIDPESLRKKLAGWKLVSTIDMTMDPTDLSTNITLILKEPVELAVEASDDKSPSQVSFTLKPVGGALK
ncbi:MAG: hypothetical protein V4760_01070 [Bdellovibrionota bacterium]